MSRYKAVKIAWSDWGIASLPGIKKAACPNKAVILLSHRDPYSSGTSKAVSLYKAVTNGELHSQRRMNKAASLYKAVILLSYSVAVLADLCCNEKRKALTRRSDELGRDESEGFPHFVGVPGVSESGTSPDVAATTLMPRRGDENDDNKRWRAKSCCYCCHMSSSQ